MQGPMYMKAIWNGAEGGVEPVKGLSLSLPVSLSPLASFWSPKLVDVGVLAVVIPGLGVCINLALIFAAGASWLALTSAFSSLLQLGSSSSHWTHLDTMAFLRTLFPPGSPRISWIVWSERPRCSATSSHSSSVSSRRYTSSKTVIWSDIFLGLFWAINKEGRAPPTVMNSAHA